MHGNSASHGSPNTHHNGHHAQQYSPSVSRKIVQFDESRNTPPAAQNNMISAKFGPIRPRIQGKAIFQNTLVNYLWDTGCDYSVISWHQFQRLQKDTPDLQLVPHRQFRMDSANNPLSIVGKVCINCCTFGREQVIIRVVMLVASDFL